MRVQVVRAPGGSVSDGECMWSTLRYSVYVKAGGTSLCTCLPPAYLHIHPFRPAEFLVHVENVVHLPRRRTPLAPCSRPHIYPSSKDGGEILVGTVRDGVVCVVAFLAVCVVDILGGADTGPDGVYECGSTESDCVVVSE